MVSEDPLPSPRKISLYFHIPFCTKKCHYCHFFVIPDKPALHTQLIHSIKCDIARWNGDLAGKELVSLYFGGGTPSLLAPDEISELIDAAAAAVSFDRSSIEVTLEANPENITLQKMEQFAKAGINRVSIGVQTLDDPLLIKLGRTHGSSHAIEAIQATSAAGIKNISIDLMYDIPHQSLHSWYRTLEQIASLPVTHLSLYNLTIEPHTVFFKYRESLKNAVPDEESSAEMYRSAVRQLKAYGLEQYEISAFGKKGYHSRHNTGYWTGRPFLGFGPSAFSYWEGKRFRAVANLNAYTKAVESGGDPADFSETLNPIERRRELLAIALRLLEGVDLNAFEERQGALDADAKNSLDKLISEGLLEKTAGRVRLTESGVLFYDTVAIELV